MNGNSEMRSGDLEKRARASDRGAPQRSAWLRAGRALRLLPLDTPPPRIARSAIRDGDVGEAARKTLSGVLEFLRGALFWRNATIPKHNCELGSARIPGWKA